MAAESVREQVERVRMMATDEGTTWDLSIKDQNALTTVLDIVKILSAAFAKFHTEEVTGEKVLDALIDQMDGKAK